MHQSNKVDRTSNDRYSPDTRSTEIGDSEYIRSLNRGVVLAAIRDHEPVSRAAIAKRTGLSRSTCSLIVDELLDRTLISEVGKGASSGGRPGVLLTMNYEAGVTVGARLLADSIDCAVVNLRGEVLERRETSISYRTDVENYIETLTTAVNNVLSLFAARVPDKPVFGLGLGLSGLVDSEAGQSISSSILHWDHIPLADRVEQELSIPVFIDNDVNTFAMGELWFGHGRGIDSFLCVTVGEGIGLGIVMGGEIYAGRHHGAGEFGHVRISDDPQAPRDAMGIQGSVEAFAADPAIREFVSNEIAAGATSKLQDSRGPIGIGAIAEAAREGDSLCRRAYERAGHYLGIGVANLINLLDPDLIVVGGEGCRARDLWGGAMETAIEANSAYGLDKRVRRIPIEFEDDVWVRGVASLVLREVFEGRTPAPHHR